MYWQKKFTILFLTIVFNFQFNYGFKILGIFPFPGKSHFVMFEPIMKGLAKNGHQVDVISHFPLQEPEENYKDFSIKGSSPEVQNNVTFEVIEGISPYFWVRDFLLLEMNPLCDTLNHSVMQDFIKGPFRNKRYDLIVTEIFMTPCFLAFGHHFKVPVVGVTSTTLYDWMNDPYGNPASPSLLFNAPNESFIYKFYKRLYNTLKHYHLKWMFEYYSQEQNKYVENYFGTDFPNVEELQKSVSLLLVNSHHSLTGVKPLTPSLVEVGGIHIQENKEKLPEDIQKWLDESKNGCIYISFGSMVLFETFPKHLIDAFYSAFRNFSDLRFLVKVKTLEKLPPGLPENVKTFLWLPQMRVFQHKNVKAFITHGGMMGGLESIISGIPMIGFPLFGDQYTNLENLVRKNIAISLNWKTVDEKQLTDAIFRISYSSIYRNNVIRLSKLYMDRPLSSLETAIFWIEYIGRNGNVLESQALNLKWWQVELLDVYGFLLLFILTISYVIYIIIFKLLNKIFSLLKLKRKEELKKRL